MKTRGPEGRPRIVHHQEQDDTIIGAKVVLADIRRRETNIAAIKDDPPVALIATIIGTTVAARHVETEPATATHAETTMATKAAALEAGRDRVTIARTETANGMKAPVLPVEIETVKAVRTEIVTSTIEVALKAVTKQAKVPLLRVDGTRSPVEIEANLDLARKCLLLAGGPVPVDLTAENEGVVPRIEGIIHQVVHQDLRREMRGHQEVREERPPMMEMSHQER